MRWRSRYIVEIPRAMHKELFNVSDLRRYGKHEKAGDTVPKSLNENMMYFDGKERDTLELLRFEENDLNSFLGCDGYQFNVIESMKSFHTKEVTSRMRTTGNTLTILSMTENFVTFRRAHCWENGSILFTHVLKASDEEIGPTAN